MALTLKHFQRRTLEALKEFLEKARVFGVEQAYAECAKSLDGRIPTYRKIEGLESIPYVCLRLPTGGGKTLLAAHSVKVAAASYLEEDLPVVLWLVPTNTIRQQTLEALKNPSHPYRQAIDGAIDCTVSVFDISEVDRIRPKDMRQQVCVVVGTLATLRVSDTDGRKIYAHNENFEPHFAGIPQATPGLERIEEGPDAGKLKFSFANLLHLHRPLVIMDEAHNARTKLTFEVLQRVSPACIIEFTATPDHDRKTGSNVLYSVSAAELKTEEMIKLPIMLTEHQSWQSAVQASIATRQSLAQAAANESGGIRPLVLFQAENKDRPVNVEALKAHLIENEKIPAEKIAIATGGQRELDGIDLFDPKCPIEYIVTVQALKEGWDCSFAYVFCSVANISSGKDVEQLLGRVLRMPYAEKRKADELNKAYAHVSSPSFAEAANSLKDSLVNMGFEEEEASQYVQQEIRTTVGLPLFTQPLSLTLTVAAAPNLEALTPEEKQVVKIEVKEPGKVEVSVSGEITPGLEAKLVSAIAPAEREKVAKAIKTHTFQQELRKAPSEKGEAFQVPRLCLRIQGELELAEKELFLDATGWSLLDFPTELTEFKFNEEARTFVFDVQGGQVVWGMAKPAEQLAFASMTSEWSEGELVRWLDKQLRQNDVAQPVMIEFLRRVVASLREKQGFDLPMLLRAKFILVKVLLERIRQYRLEAYRNGYQETLFGPQAAVEVSFDYGFRFDPKSYPAKELYRGGYRFTKHFYPLPGELENKGEEFDCAVAIDSLPEVKFWVRNLARQPQASFWLPTSSDSFYPDFVALLNDGRILVVEYKGAHLADTADTKEKRAIGELWEAKSSGRSLFLMAEFINSKGKNTRNQLIEKIM